jgi:hypothetical protein
LTSIWRQALRRAASFVINLPDVHAFQPYLAGDLRITRSVFTIKAVGWKRFCCQSVKPSAISTDRLISGFRKNGYKSTPPSWPFAQLVSDHIRLVRLIEINLP